MYMKFSAIILVLITALFGLFVATFLYLREKKRFLAYFSISWFLLTSRLLLELFGSIGFGSIIEVSFILEISSTLFFYWGSSLLLEKDKKDKKVFAGYAAILVSVYIVILYLLEMNLYFGIFPVFLFTGILLLLSSYNIFKVELPEYSKHFLGWAVFFWGIHKIDYPFMTVFVLGETIEYLLSFLIISLVTFGLLIAFYEKLIDEVETKSEQLEFITGNIRDFIFRLSVNPRKIEYISDSASEVTGYRQDEIKSEKFLEKVIVKKDLERLTGIYKRPEHEWVDKIHTVRARKKDGSLIYLEISFSPFRDQNGKVVALDGVARNVTNLRNLETSVQLFKTALEQNSVGVMIFAKDGKLIYANKTISDTFDVETNKLIGKSMQQLNKIDKYSDLTDFLSKCTPKGRQVIPVAKNGNHKQIYLTCNIYSVKAENEDYLGDVYVFTDVTDSILAQRETERMKIFESLRTFAGSLSHDFNNLLTTVIGNVEYVKECSYLEDDEKEALKDTSRAALKAKEIASELLSISKPSELKKEQIAVTGLIRSVFEMLDKESREKIELQINTTAKLEVDIGKIERAIFNVLKNAVEVTPELDYVEMDVGKVTVYKDNIFSLVPGNYVKISIEDKGPGIKKEDLDKIFEPFYTKKKK